MNASLLSCRAVWIIVVLVGSRAAGGEHGLYFGGPGGTVELPALKASKQITVEFRFKVYARMHEGAKLVSQWSDEANAKDKGAFALGVTSLGQVVLSLRDAKGATKAIVGRYSAKNGTWHHAAGTWDGATMKVYLDGKEAASRQIPDFAGPGASSLPLLIGHLPPKGRTRTRRRVAGRSTMFEGFISDAAVWSKSLTADAIARHMAKPIGGDEDGLKAYVALRESAPTPVVRNTVSGAEGKLTEAITRVGWCVTPMWHEAKPNAPILHVFGYNVSAPSKPPAGGASAGPDPNGASRQIIVTNAKTSQVGLLWQDKASGAIYVTWVAPGFEHHETIRLKSMPDSTLAGGTADPAGNLFYLEIQKSKPGRDVTTALVARFHRARPDGTPVGDMQIDTTKGKGGFNIFSYGGRWGGSLVYHRGALAMVLPRTMYKSPDGLNHQGAIAAVLSPTNPSAFTVLGQTSGHSFGNVLTVNSRGECIAVDLGDNYPRGVHLHKFTHRGKASRVVYTFKTAHAKRPRNDSPLYAEISGGGKTFYKWSNDNATYTELGGVVEGRRCYSVIFSTDRSLTGRVLDNSRAIRNSGDPRDLAMVCVVKNFQSVRQKGNVVTDSLLAVIPKGSPVETGGFYGFNGRWADQRVTGVIWLTKYGKGEGAHAPQAVPLGNGNVLILWEKTGPTGPSVHTMTVTEMGEVVTGETDLGINLRFNREDRSVAIDNRIFLLARDKARGITELCFIYDH